MKLIKKIINFFKIFRIKRKQRKLNKNNSQPMGLSYIDARQETNVLDVDLVDDNASEKDKKKIRQYTKILVTSLTIMACLWISTSYILAAVALVLYGNAEPLSSLSEKVCEVIIGTVIAYSLKSLLESYSAAKHDLDVMRLEYTEKETINNDEPMG